MKNKNETRAQKTPGMRRNDTESAGIRVKRERSNKIKCVVYGLLCFGLVLFIMLDTVTPQKYNIEAGEVSKSTIVATKDIMDTVSLDAAKKVARDSVSTIYRIDEEARVNVINAVADDFSKVEDARRQAVNKKNEWLLEHPGTDYQFEDAYINLLTGNLPVSCSESEMLVIVNTPPQDIESIAAFIKTKISSVMIMGLSEETLISQRSAIVASMNTEYSAVSGELRLIARRILEKELVANYAPDETATEAARLEAENAVDESDYLYKKGQNIVVSGELVTAAQVAMLEQLGMLDNNNIDIKLYLGAGLLVLTVLLIVAFYIAVYEPQMVQTPKKVLMLAILIVLSVLYSSLVYPYQPGLAQIAISTILIAVLLKPRVALVSNLALSVILGVLATQSSELVESSTISTMVVSLIAGTAAVYLCKKPMHRMRIMLAGLTVGLTGGLASIFIGLVLSSEIKTVFINSLWPVLGGAISSVLCIGTLPVWEAVFDILTPTKLLEITNPNQPLLRRLAIEAPGTHHHSIVVANLAESGAQAIGADTMLTRAGAYYHDIGKLASPEAYTENQNDKLKSFHSMLLPSESAAIIKAHPTEGCELAVKHKLPKEICDIIQEHHGTTVISYFYAKALEEFDNVNRADYMYPGPKPHSKETAIIMLADSVEAAVRSLPDKSPESVRAKIDQIISDRIADGQFDECSISMLELHKIAAEFTQSLSGVHHQRIEYPDLKQAIKDNMEREKANENRTDK